MPFRQAFGPLFTLDTTIAWAVYGLVSVTLIAALLLGWRRRRSRTSPSQRSEANRLEIGYLSGRQTRPRRGSGACRGAYCG